MTLKYRTKGFVFKKDETAESDQIFAVFTKDFGKLELKAKAIRKITSKLRADIDIFYLSEIEFIQGKNIKTLTDAVKINKFESIAKDFKNLKIAYQIADTLDNFLKGQEKDEQTFNLLDEIFYKLADSKFKIKNNQLLFQYFFWNFISLQGYHLHVEVCAVCQGKLNPYNVYFSGNQGGIICKKCLSSNRDVKKINSDVVKILRLIFKKDWQTLSKLKMEMSSQKLLEEVLENAGRDFCPA